MSDLIEALHTLARQRGRNGSPLLGLRHFPQREGTRISHLGISPHLAQAWVAVTGEPFRPHQSLALSALRRREPVALIGGADARRTLQLLAVDLLREQAPATVLVLVPDAAAAEQQCAEIEALCRALNEPLRVAPAFGPGARAAMSAHVVVATPAVLHERLLRYHDRAWAGFWARLQLIVLADAHHYTGLAAIHLAGLLLRARRLAGGGGTLQLAATIAPVAGAEAALAALSGEAWRLIVADDGPAVPTALALWRLPGERVREAAALALGLSRAGARVHISCAPFEAALLQALVGRDVDTVSVGPSPRAARAQVLIGVDGAAANLHQALDAGSLCVLLLGDDPAERALAQLVERRSQRHQAPAALAGERLVSRVGEPDSEPIPLVDRVPPRWVVAPANAYVEAQHLVCAAAERPISAAEVAEWQMDAIVARLERNGLLVRLPEELPAWQPGTAATDPYPGFELGSAATAPVQLVDDQGAQLGALSLAVFDRWGHPGAALPPIRGGYRVVSRDESALTLRVHGSPEPRRTFPLRRCSVQVRDCIERRALRGRELGWGRVVVDEEVYGYREAAPGAAPLEAVLSPPLTVSWSAPALWFELPAGVNAEGPLVGWSLVLALPLLTLCTVSDLVPAYDARAGRIYFVDAQPGGNGLAAWLFSSLEHLLPVAYDVALACRADALLEPLAHTDRDWLLALLGGGPATTSERAAERVEREPPRREQPAHLPRQEAPAPLPAVPPPRAEPPFHAAQDLPPAPARRQGAREPGRGRRAAQQSGPARNEPPAHPAPSAAQPPHARELPPTPPEPEQRADADAIVERLRRLRAQRQAAAQAAAPRQPPPDEAGEPRFAPGDVIVCVPYGRGEVLASRLEDGRELLVVRFATHGELTLDAALSLAHHVDRDPPTAQASQV